MIRRSLFARVFGRQDRRWVHPTTHEIWKFLPHNPPRRGEIVLVDGERSRVLKSLVRWEGRTWAVNGIKVEPADPQTTPERSEGANRNEVVHGTGERCTDCEGTGETNDHINGVDPCETCHGTGVSTKGGTDG